MRKLSWLHILSILLVLSMTASPVSGQPVSGYTVSGAPPSVTAVQAPVLKWQHGGCYSSWCETGWYSSPAVADLNHDGKMEVIGSAYTIFALDGKTGSLLWKIASGYDRNSSSNNSVGRTWPGIVVADVDGDGQPEIVTAHSGGVVSMYDRNGYFKPGWPQKPVTEELRSLAVADLDGDGKMEIAVGRAQLAAQNIWVFNSNGTLRAGWPQRTGAGSTAGIYNNNIAIGSLLPGANQQIVAPSDVITIAAYDANGSPLPTHAMYHGKSGQDRLTWSLVSAYVDPVYELQGYGPCDTQFTPRANFADGPANIVDMNGDGINEVVAIGNVHNCNTSPYTDLYFTPFIFNADRSRFKTGGYDWNTPPVNTGAPISEDYNVIETAEPNPVTVDLDGDGKLETLFASFDGRLHAFWLDKTEHGHWPFSVYHAADGYKSFASEPVVADLNNDGIPEVIFASWTQIGSHASGKLTILDNLGNQLQAVALPPAFGGDWNGSLAAPTLADIDGDGNLEVVLNTAHAGLVAYTLPGTANAKVLWGTGRGNMHRTGVQPPSLERSGVTITPLSPAPGAELTVTIAFKNSGLTLGSVSVTGTLPAEMSYLGGPVVSSGVFQAVGQTITWKGAAPMNQPVTISFQVQLSSALPDKAVITNPVQIAYTYGQDITLNRQGTSIINGLTQYLPLVAH